jgi:hypothetical protein
MQPFRNLTPAALAAHLQRLAGGVKAQLHPRAVFVLLVADEGAEAQYITNAQRTDAIQLLRATADRLEGRATSERVPFPEDPNGN